MAFTTQMFMFAFFPIAVALYFLVALLQEKGIFSRFFLKYRVLDITILAISLLFYMWACAIDVFLFLGYIFVIYVIGVVIQRIRQSSLSVLLQKGDGAETVKMPVAVLVCALGVAFTVFVLVYFKYTGFLTRIWNFFFKDSLEAKTVMAPLGISFITFSAISYLVDIYRNKAAAGSLLDCALYLTFFPKVVSGPIVLWRDFANQKTRQLFNLTNISDGIFRIMIGFAKKLILADTFGTCIAQVNEQMDGVTAFVVGLLYMLQIYYDFSGYSDVAIGLAKLMGFSFKENFDFPYLSCSITEFWRRWHISLGTWFREYIYFPLGGSRAGIKRTFFNIGVVFVLTGIWHGAGWTYMLWGILNGVCNIAEKALADNKLYRSVPKFVKWFATMGITYFAWQLFRAPSGSACLRWLASLLGAHSADTIPYTWQYYVDTRLVVFVIIGILGATVWGLPKIQKFVQSVSETKIGYVCKQIVYVLLFLVSILFMINSDYSPFIYFQY